MNIKRVTTALALACGLLATTAQAQTMLEKAVIGNGGGRAVNSTTALDYTVGQSVAGHASNSTMNGDFGFWYAAAAAPSSVDESVSAGSVTSARITPNPVVSSGTVEITLSRAGKVELALSDLNGRAVANLFSGDRSAGSFSVPFSVTGLPSGTYYVAISVPGALVQRQVTVVR